MSIVYTMLLLHSSENVCMYVQRLPFVEMPMGSGVPTGPRGGTHWARGSNISTPRCHRYRVTHADPYSRTRRFPEQLLLWAAKGDLCPHVDGAESHRAHKGPEHVLKYSIHGTYMIGTGHLFLNLELVVVSHKTSNN